MLGILKTWWSRKSFVFFLRLISPQRSRELARMKQRLTRWLPARPHTCPLIVYTWDYLSCFPQLAASNQNSTCRVFEQKRYLSIHLKILRLHAATIQHMCPSHPTRAQTYAHTVCTPHAYCTRLLRAPYAQTARTVRAHRAHRTHTTRAPYAHPARTPRTPRTHTPHAHTARPVRTPSRTRTVGYKSKACSHPSWI